jgi:predicted GNAT family N-acyltransferase
MQIIAPSTPDEYRRYYELRWKILRAPWNQPRGSEQDELEASSSHFMAIDSKQVIRGVARLQFNTIREAQIRYMAIAIEQQRQGIGTLLMQVLEDRAIELGAARIVLDAREHALGFYRKQGYTLEGPGHTLFDTIPHVKMSKTLE